MFATRRITQHKYNKIEKGLIDYNMSEFYQPSMVDDFLFVKTKPPFSEEESITITSDITMLFNQKRLDKMTTQALIQHFESMAQKSSSFNELRSKLSDEQLCSIVKSRYIQSPSELMAYSNYLVNTYGANVASLASAAGVDSAGDSGDSSSGDGTGDPS